jgi:mannose/fructose/N-acetylgalactosamine-specific phosphotransferase system component IIB
MSWMIHRIDDRLIHGQVVIAWGERLRPRRIVVADDASASNAWERDLLATAAPGIEVDVLPLAETAARYGLEAAREGGAFLLVRSLAAALRLVEDGAPVPRFTLGGLHYAPGKDKVNEYVYLDAADRRAARALLEHGVKLEVQDVPASRPIALEDLDLSVRSA